MPPQTEKSSLKRGLPSTGEPDQDSKKLRRSQRNGSQNKTTPVSNKGQLPSPLTHKDSSATEDLAAEPPVTPPRQQTPPVESPSQRFSPPSDTQPLSQFRWPAQGLSHEVQDEEAEGVWGYLIPADSHFGDTLVLRKRTACAEPSPDSSFGKGTSKRDRPSSIGLDPEQQEKSYENEKEEDDQKAPAGGYLVGRHRECDQIIEEPMVSNRHFLIFAENKGGGLTAFVEDLSTNGTFVNDAIIGRNKRRELKDGDEISIVTAAKCIFRYPKSRETNAFRQQYRIIEQLGKGHFAVVYLCVNKSSGERYAAKRFEKRRNSEDRARAEALHQEIAVLMGVSHPNVLCLKDTFDEEDGLYILLELAPEGELFNWIVMKQKLTEEEARRVFIQLFQAVKYLHDRNIVHRDIKPENILLMDKKPYRKTGRLWISQDYWRGVIHYYSMWNPKLKYTRAVDVWSLGVVLYICLCGFPPFSDELYTAENPYTLSQQIKMGRFDYPSPYWDPVSDAALDLIDRMLTVNYEERITVEECLHHPWVTGTAYNPNDSTEGLAGALHQLDFSKRKPQRERTLLASINDVQVSKVIDEPTPQAVTVYRKNSAGNQLNVAADIQAKVKGPNSEALRHEPSPAANRAVDEFMELGGKGDQVLFGGTSNYPEDVLASKKE